MAAYDSFWQLTTSFDSLWQLTIVHSKTRRSWFYILIGYNSLTNDTIRKSMGCFKKFKKFPIWWTLRFSNLVKGELRKLSLKILNWFLKVCFFSHITALLIFLGELASLTTVFSGIFWQKTEVFVIIGMKISWIL